MKRIKNKLIVPSLLSFITIIFLFFVSAIPRENIEKNNYGKHNSEEIHKNHSDTIRALIYINGSDYFIHKGAPAGFQYELLKELGKSLNKVVEFTIEDDLYIAYNKVFIENYDIVSIDYKKNPLLDYYLTFSEAHSYNMPVLIGTKKQPGNSHSSIFVTSEMIEYIDSIPEEDKRNIVHLQNENIEKLFEKVENSENDYLICGYNEAIALLPSHKNLKIEKTIGAKQECRWILNEENRVINDSINEWLLAFKKGRKYSSLCNKYLSENSNLLRTAFHQDRINTISPYDDIVKKYADKYGFDWKYISSIIFQETKFHADLVGKGGSFGLMQMMPVTGKSFGVDKASSPEEQIEAGVRYLKFLEKQYSSIQDEEEKLKFIAGAYNSGPGHINDARRLCSKYGQDSSSWVDVAKYLTLKTDKNYINDTVVKHGYYPGKHTVKYVKQVMDRFSNYVCAIKE